jgi:hypothetical protein
VQHEGERIGEGDQRIGFLAQDRREGAIELLGREHLRRGQRLPDASRCDLRVFPLDDLRLIVRIPQDHDAGGARNDLFEKFHPLAREIGGERAHAGDVAAGMRETGD